MAHAVYKEFINPEIVFTHFVVFTGVAYPITAFPVLCLILTERKLSDMTVGTVVLSAGVGKDIGLCSLTFPLSSRYISWMDPGRSLSVALVNAGNSLSVSYILFGCHSAGFPGKRVVVCPSIVPSKNVSPNSFLVESGPTVFMMVTILIPFGSAFFQMSPEFMPSSAARLLGRRRMLISPGAFIAGLIVPRAVLLV